MTALAEIAPRPGRPANTLAKVAEIIVSRSSPEPNTGCWLWTMNANRQGYGKVKLLGKTAFAHRASYLAFNGPIIGNLQVCHHCDVPACVNPSHLFLGTSADNHRDRNRKGRQARGDRQGLRRHPHKSPKGELNGGAKLTAEQVLAIRTKLSDGVSTRVIAQEYGMSIPAIQFISRRKTWKHL